MKDFGQGCGTGALVGIGLGTIVTFQQYLERRELMTIFIGSIFFTPIVINRGRWWWSSQCRINKSKLKTLILLLLMKIIGKLYFKNIRIL